MASGPQIDAASSTACASGRVDTVRIVGAGLSGLACAIAAAAAGREVDVYDAVTEREPDAAAHVDLCPAAVRALAALGIGEAAARSGFAYHGVDVVNPRNERLFDWSTPQLAGVQLPSAMGIGEARFLALVEAAALRHGVRVHRGVRIEAGADGRFSEPAVDAADLVVLAAGLDSPLRRALVGPAPGPAAVEHYWWQAVLPRPLGLHRATWVVGPDDAKLLLLPITVAEAGIGMARPASALAACGATVSRGASLRAALGFAAAALPSLETRLDDAAAVSVRPVRAELLPPPWYRGGVLCVGDCAHALPPLFGQAIAESLADAVVLGELLREDAGRDALPAAFTARRTGRAGRVHALVSQAARWSRRPEAGTDLLALAAELDAVVASPA